MGGDRRSRILAGVDGSAPSRLSLEWAVSEARLRNGQVRGRDRVGVPARDGRDGRPGPEHGRLACAPPTPLPDSPGQGDQRL
jgi:nucleotide-binding universal stress UspA family protein